MLYLLPHAVERAAERDPDHQAVRCAGRHLTYAELSERSDRLARVLIDEGVGRGDRVGLYLGKGLTAAVAMYGVMKANAAYVPLDPTAPPARGAFIVRDCGIRHLVGEPARQAGLDALLAEGIELDSLIGAEPSAGGAPRSIPWSEVDASPGAPATLAIERDLAYILYTSGSTGTPKGVMHTHRSALAWAEISAHTYGFRSDDRLSNHAPLHFDLSTLDYFAAAVAGATTVIIPEPWVKLPASLSSLLEEERMSVLYAVPFALVQLLLHGALDKRDLSSLRWVLFGGEPFPPKHLNALMDLLPHARFSNVYGPTETNGCTYHVVSHHADRGDDPVPIGRPYGNVEALVVDEADEPVAPGEVGHLLIRSPTTMLGYWGRADLDERAFHRRRSFGHHEDVFHRTGDLVRWSAEGELEFLGRKDRQVKVRGYRIELDEIEAVLTGHADVESAAVFAVPDEAGSLRVEAAVVLRPERRADSAELAAHAARHLPPHSVPARVAILAEFPRTSTGKVDRLRLPALVAPPSPTVRA